MADEQIIYLSPEEELTSVRERSGAHPNAAYYFSDSRTNTTA